MTAPTKAFTVVADSSVDPASPVDTVLMTALRDNDIHLREWLGFSYEAAAAQDHNHDGVNSAPVAGAVGHMEPWPGLVLPSGGGGTWDWCDGNTLSRATYSALKAVLMAEATVTISIASPAVVTWTAHGLRTNMPIRFFTTGALPTGITAGTHGGPGVGTEYFVKVIDANTFNIAATPGGASINTSGTQSGVHTGTVAPHGDGDGSTTFHKPDYRGMVPVGRDDMGGTAANRVTSGGSGILGNVPGRSGGAETVTLTSATMPPHNHSASGNIYVNDSISAGISGESSTQLTVGTGAPVPVYNLSIGNTGSGGAHQNTQPSRVCDWIIRIA